VEQVAVVGVVQVLRGQAKMAAMGAGRICVLSPTSLVDSGVQLELVEAVQAEEEGICIGLSHLAAVGTDQMERTGQLVLMQRLSERRGAVVGVEQVGVKIMVALQGAMVVMGVDALVRVVVALPQGVGAAVVGDARGVAAKMVLPEPQGPTELVERQAPQVQQVVFQVAGGSPVGRVVRVEMVREVAAAKGEAVAQVRGGGTV